MAEREFEMTPYGVDYVCDECHVGRMEPHGPVSGARQKPHRCTNCGHERALAMYYPSVRWRRSEAPDGK